MIKRSVLLLIVVFSLLSFVNASVFINEVELNPSGSEAVNEWVEIFNDGSGINLSGWYIEDEAGHVFDFPSEIMSRFYVLDNLSDLNNADEVLKLYDNAGVIRDVFENLDDGNDDSNTWSRNPDGNGGFVFQENTRGMPNQPTLIASKESNPSCLIAGDLATLSAEVTGYCIEDVIFSTYDNAV